MKGVLIYIVLSSLFLSTLSQKPVPTPRPPPNPQDAAASARYLIAQSLWGVLRPCPDDAPNFARWLVSQSSWGVLNTISSDWGGAPFGNVVSFSDGLPDKGKGIPEYSLGTCGNTDPENPICAKITLIGKLKLVDGNSKEAEFGRSALFVKHPEMKGWPKSHNFQVFKLEIENIFMINWFGGPKPLTVDQYLHAKM
ncbi:Pyridoxamine 5'-phosphate oxidase family protein [Abeliophyllum distichum]|uniref:Pyridoxamine 5'-phosphate oxidase family protein n=1 Tax=Abeliophyllum distichum TaxID=126358 RepID=A0ABD1SHE4_9LAMI